MKTYNVGDFYWEYADKILRGLGVKESVYDERVLAFMALKMLIDNKSLNFNFDYENNFNAKKDHLVFKGKELNLRETLLNIIENIKEYDNTKYFIKDKSNLKKYQRYNLDKLNISNELEVFNHKEIFHFDTYLSELKNDDNLKLLLDIYNNKANFVGYPRNKYKNLYEEIVTRMKDLSGSLTGQHFTQDNIIHLMTDIGINEKQIKNKIKDKSMYRIYDLACGVGSMLYESAYRVNEKYNLPLKQIELLGQELNGPSWLLAKVFCEVQGIKNFIAYGNTLTEPFIMDFVKLKGNNVDFIIANPPFGMDWKSEEKKIKKHIEDNTVWSEEGELISNDSDFYLFEKGNKKDKYATPKMSDGQFLFFMHNLRIMELTNKEASKSVILSSTSLASNGKDSSNEGIIRKGMIEKGYVDCLIEQPNNMFVNTDIKTHFWVLNSEGKEQRKNETFLINIDNDFTHKPFNGKKKMRVLYGDASVRLEKQKNGYRESDIEHIVNIYHNRKNGLDLFYKLKSFKENYLINFGDEFKKDSLDIIKYEPKQMLKFMEKAYFGEVDEIIVNKAMKLIDGSLLADEYYSKYSELYSEVLKNVENLTTEAFYNKIRKLEGFIMKDIEKNILGKIKEDE